MEKHQERMEMDMSSFDHCNHSKDGFSLVCLSPECDDKFLCEKCNSTHNAFHNQFVKPIDNILELKNSAKIKEIKDIIERRITKRKTITNHYKTMLDKMKKEIEQQIEQRKIKVLSDEKIFEVNELDSINKLAEEISTLHKQSPKKYFGSIAGRAKMEMYIDKYVDVQSYLAHAKELEQKEFKSLSHKELQDHISLVLRVVDEALEVFKEAYFGVKQSNIKQNGEKKASDHKDEDDSVDQVLYAKAAFLNATPNIQNDKDDKLPKNIKIPEQIPFNIEFNIRKLQEEFSVQLPATPGLKSMEYIQDKELVVIGDIQGNLSFWNASTWDCLSMEKYHKSKINVVKYSKQKNYIITASDDYKIKVIKTNNPPDIDEIVSLTKHTDHVWIILPIEDHNVFYSSGKEACIIGWDMNTLELKHKIDTRGRDHTGTEMTFIPSLKLLAVSFKQGTISFYNIDTPSEMRSINVYQKWLHCLKYIEDKDELLVGTDIGTIKVFSIEDYKFYPEREYKFPGGLPVLIDCINYGQDLLIASKANKYLVKTNYETGEHENSKPLLNTEITNFKLLPDLGKVIISCNEAQIMVIKY